MKYIIKFKKTGVICYTSHLDILKVFKRSFKRAGIRLAYSQGFNPHPKMGFAQPLSLGYKSFDEYMEFETYGNDDTYAGNRILTDLRAIMPEGITLVSIVEAPDLRKTLASLTVAADYEIRIPLNKELSMSSREIWNTYMGQNKILVLKKQKKKPEPVLVDIKDKIREITFNNNSKSLVVSCRIDAGSDSNLSPELLIDSIADTFDLQLDRSDIEIIRMKLYFRNFVFNNI